MSQLNNKQNTISEEPTASSSTAMKSPVLDNAWKAVGSPSRRGSAVNIPLMEKKSEPMDDINLRRSSVIADPTNMPSSSAMSQSAQWGSFGGFQWEGPSIFDEEAKGSIPPSQAPDVVDMSLYNAPYESSILSVPMLPGVSMEPIYRQQRSLSFSMGQDPTFFGYDDYDDQPPQSQQMFKTSLATMEEEEDMFDEIDLTHIRSRSKSSGAAFGLLSQAQHSRLMNTHIRRGSEQDDIISQRRRSSSRFFNGTPNEPYAQMSMGDKERLDILQRRMSQQNQDYIFPDNNFTNMLNQRRQSLTLNTQPASNIQQLADQLENTHLRNELPLGFHPQQASYRNDLFTPAYPYQPPAPSSSSSTLHQQVADDYFEADPRGFQDLGKGIPLHRLDPKLPLYMVEFKAGRTDFFYVLDSHQFSPQIGDLVIVEADRGKDLGKVAMNTLTIDQVTELEQRKQQQLQQLEHNDKEEDTSKPQREIHIKRIFRLAAPDEVNLLLVKGQDEHKALVVCQQKTKQRKLPMEVVDAEYQWDRRKLTFYFEAEHRIDFRELVRELFKIYKTRIWMCVVTPPLNLDSILSKND